MFLVFLGTRRKHLVPTLETKVTFKTFNSFSKQTEKLGIILLSRFLKKYSYLGIYNLVFSLLKYNTLFSLLITPKLLKLKN